MEDEALVASLQRVVPGAQFERSVSSDLHTTLYVSRDDVPALARALRDDPALEFSLLAELTAADYWPREPRF